MAEITDYELFEVPPRWLFLRVETSDVLDYLADPAVFDYDDGYVDIPDDPGLGVEIDEEYVRQQSQTELDWQNPIWYHHDGSVAEW